MDAAKQSDPDRAESTTPEAAPLRVSHWLWRPRYAKLWWFCAVLYWTGFALSFFIPTLEAFYSTALAGYLNVAFYPPVILMILGVGYVRAKLDRSDWILTPGNPEAHKFSRSVGGSLDPYSDPLDPRSGSLWIGSPQSRARLFGRKWP